MNANRIAQTAAAAVVALSAVAGGMFVSGAASADQQAATSYVQTVAPAAEAIAAGYTAAREADEAAAAAEAAAAEAAAAEAAAMEAMVPATGEGEEVAGEVTPAVEEAQPAEAEAPAVENEAAAQAPASEPAQPANDGVWVIDVNCAGGQGAIDTCIGATNYLPAMDVLGVPYYAQHDYLGGAAWLAMNIGDYVQAEGVMYQVSDYRTIVSGGSSAQIHDMYADAFLQTCTGDGVHSRVLALVRVG